MITVIHIKGAASYKGPASLKTDKKINLVYVLNGTGKSTLSNFLYNPTDFKFSKCKKIPDQSETIFVYNQKFIRGNFFIADNLKDIFSLSKQNEAAEEKITQAQAAIKKQESLFSRRNRRGRMSKRIL